MATPDMNGAQLDAYRQEARAKVEDLMRMSHYADEREWLGRLMEGMRYAGVRQIQSDFECIAQEGLS